MADFRRTVAYWQEVGLDTSLELGHVDSARESIQQALTYHQHLGSPSIVTHFLRVKEAAIPLYEHAHAARVVANTPLTSAEVENALETNIELLAKTQREIESTRDYGLRQQLAGAQGEHATLILPLVDIATRGYYFLPASAWENKSRKHQIDLRTVDLQEVHAYNRQPVQVKLDLEAPRVEFSPYPDIRHVGLMQINPEARRKHRPGYDIRRPESLPNLLIAHQTDKLSEHQSDLLGTIGVRLDAVMRTPLPHHERNGEGLYSSSATRATRS